MSGIAEVLLTLGYKVTGSDLSPTETTKRLEELGGRVFIGHRESNVGEAQVVVISSAVSWSNPEVLEARRKHVPVIPRAEMLCELMRLKYGVAIAGAHGKTTTTSMVAVVLAQAGLDPTDWKPMPSVGKGVREIRVSYRGQWRMIYVATLGDAVYVLHAFHKKTQRTAKADIEIAKQRLKEVTQREPSR